MKLSICRTCGKQFLQFAEENYQNCRICYLEWRREQNQKREEAESLKWLEQRKRDREIFEKEISAYTPVSMDSISPSAHTLYIIGNGFDIMHRVQSKYYDFRDSLGKNSSLKWQLEVMLEPEDIWADFENSLGKIRLDMMGRRAMIDRWLEDSGFYEDDAGAAEFAMAADAAVSPMQYIAEELPPAFRKWVAKLKVGTDDRPLKKMICPEGKALDFNYTEFVETLYGVKDVCYIHGCRKKKERLILGHVPGAIGAMHERVRKPRTFRQAAVKLAQDNVFELISQYDSVITKDCREIIKEHSSFFQKLNAMEQVVVIGHSLSLVDWDYFFEVNKASPNSHWYFGIHGVHDLKNLGDLIKALNLKKYSVFRTDSILTKPKDKCYEEIKTPTGLKNCTYREGETTVTVNGRYDMTIDRNFEVVLPKNVRNVFSPEKHIILIMLDDKVGSVLLFTKVSDRWVFVSRLEGFEHQSLINRRLHHVFYAEGRLTFVYNNRVRVYDLSTGEMTVNRQFRDAKDSKYQGEDITEKLLHR